MTCLAFSFWLVFHKWNAVTPMRWVGLANFWRLLHDEQFFKALGNTLIFLALHIPLQIGMALALALMLNAIGRGRAFYRAVFFLPVVISGVVVTILWNQLYAYEGGLLNRAAATLCLPPLPWLVSPQWAMPSIALMATWKNQGLYVVLFLVGLTTIPRYLYEASALDGATALQNFRHITLPALNSTMVLVVLLSTIGGFSLFIEPFVMTGGGPMSSTLSAILYIYNQGFYFGHMGYAAALGFAFAVLILTVVLVLRRLIERRD